MHTVGAGQWRKKVGKVHLLYPLLLKYCERVFPKNLFPQLLRRGVSSGDLFDLKLLQERLSGHFFGNKITEVLLLPLFQGFPPNPPHPFFNYCLLLALGMLWGGVPIPMGICKGRWRGSMRSSKRIFVLFSEIFRNATSPNKRTKTLVQYHSCVVTQSENSLTPNQTN